MAARKHLYLLRHAKSSWDEPGMNDHERPLAPRGRKAAVIMHEHLVANHIEPELVLCSSSRRTRETMDDVAPTGERLIERDLYDADTSDILTRLHQIPDGVSSVMVIGHNPAMQALTLRLAGKRGRTPEDSPLAEVERKFPTAALATISFEGTWSALESGELLSFVRPKALRNGAVR